MNSKPAIRRIPPASHETDVRALRVTVDVHTYERLTQQAADVAAFVKGERRAPLVAIQ